jgi:hypothetical protein
MEGGSGGTRLHAKRALYVPSSQGTFLLEFSLDYANLMECSQLVRSSHATCLRQGAEYNYIFWDINFDNGQRGLRPTI